MKTKVSKRILSVLLAALMIITSVPITVFAFNISADIDASKDPAVIEVSDAMTAYEKKMDGKVYTNMSAAYNAYVDAQKAIDAYVYGGVANALDGKAAALTAATNAMTEWSAATFTAPAYHSGNGESNVATGGYSNIVYASQTTNFTNETRILGGTGVNYKLAVPNVIVNVYDGVNPVTSPIVFEAYGQDNTNPKFDYVRSNDTVLGFTKNWEGYMDASSGYQKWPGDNIASKDAIGYTTDNKTETTANLNKNSSHKFYWNSLTYLGSGNTSDYYEKVSNINFTAHGYRKWNLTAGWADGSVTTSHTNYIINYKPIVTYYNILNSKLISAFEGNYSVSDYTQGGLTELMAAFDKLTADNLNPNNYSYDDSTAESSVQSCAAAIKNYVAFYTEPTVGSRDYKAYENLRSAMNAKMAAYNNGVNNGLTEASYAKLKTAYENAMDIMRNGYDNPTGAQDAADILNGLVLETAEQKVDATALATVIDAFEAYDHIFTDDSYNNVANVVYTAKEVVWGAENKYGDPASLLTLSDENQEKVAQQTAAVEEAIKALRVDADSIVATQYGRMSLNDALALVGELNADDYSNYGEIKTVADKANEYIAKCAITDLTNYDSQYAEYIAEIEKVMAAYNSRKASFMAIPNGLAFKNTGINYLSDMTRNDQGTVGVGFSYTDKAVVFRKTHDALNATYGTATVKLISGIKTGSSTPLANNMLDSFSINAGDDTKTGWINGYSGTSSKPPALTSDQKTAYPGCLTYQANDNGVIALERLTYAGRSGNNNCPRIITLQDGTEITDETTAYATDLTTILGTTDGISSDPGRGGVFARTSNNDVAETYVSADMTISLPATTPQKLTASTDSIQYTNYAMRTNFAAVVLRNIQNTTAVSGYERFTSVSNQEKIYTQVEVIDIAYLVDLINMCNELVKNDSAKYTDASLKNFTDALSKAQEPLDYTNQTVSTSTLVERCKTRYVNLWDAYQSLELKKLAVTFNYKNADGTDASTVIQVTPGDSLSKYADEVNAITAPQWISADGALKYTFKEWSPAFDVNASILIDTAFTAIYDSESNLADFIAYNNAKAALMGKFVDETYTTADLEAVNAAISEMKYYNFTDEEKAVTMGTEQAAINAETAKLVELAENLKASDVDVTGAKALVEKAKAEAGIDEDVYNLGSLDFSYTSEVTVGDEKVIGLTFGNQDDVDAAIRAALNASNLNKRVYTIYLNGNPVGSAEYGSPVIVDSNGSFAKDVPDMDVNISDGAKMVAWSYSYAAPSRNNEKSIAKYMLTASSLGFIVKGDTYLTTANAAENEEGYVVKFTTNDGKVFDVQYTTNGTVTVPAAPNYAFYTFTGYEGGYQKGDVIPVSSNMTITANYDADTESTLSILFFDSILNWNQLQPSNLNNNVYNYSELVEFSSPNAYCWVSAIYNEDNDTTDLVLLSYGGVYSFCAARSYDNNMLEGIVAVSESDYQSILSGKMSNYTLYDGAGNKIEASIDSQWGGYIYPDPVATVSVLDEVVPVYNSSNKLAKFSMIGTFTLPEGYEIVEAGILFTSQQGSDLKVENVGKNGIARFKSSRHTAGNQFVINVNAPSDGRVVSFDYAAYAIVKDANGNLKTLYSKTVPGTTQGL